ncbi:hypothetical protein SCHPADRAFT_938590 [Schizopora paradoxa]|uniref:DUF6534 domain-containing protein n=1 Tax=Schizopora paradoxa TaxID=27342 RepID=A0A0H2SEX4_9AGAM|nr:hypothetical protein SCHPADRAFT_938590 [Schizopora paradoxa]
MPDVVTQIGPLFIGTILNYLFTGILIHQLFNYSNNFPDDKLRLKWLVYGVCALDMFQTGLTTQLSWYYCVQNWGNESLSMGSGGFTWTASSLAMMAGLIAMIVQLYYAWRIWSLGGRYLKWCSVAICLIAIIECLAALIGSIKFDIIGITRISPEIVPYFVIWLSGSFSCDVLIAVSMTVIFVRAKTLAGFERTISIINVLILHAVETAAITALCAGVELLLFCITRNKSLAHTAPAFVLGKLYTNCLLANLNSRKHLSSAMNPEVSCSTASTFRFHNIRPSFDRKRQLGVDSSMSIRVEEVRHVHRDGEDAIVSKFHEVDVKGLEEAKFWGNEASAHFAYSN